MIRRRRTQREIPFSFDSFLDVVANVVGIILRLILVAWVGARSYHPEAVVAPAPAAVVEETPDAPEPPAPPDPLEDQVTKHRRDLAAVRDQLLSQSRLAELAKERRDHTAKELAEATAKVQTLKAERAAVGHAPAGSDKEGKTVALSLPDIDARIRRVQTDMDALQKLPSAKRALHYQTPVSQLLQTEELFFECQGGRVTVIDVGAMLEQMHRDRGEKAKQLATQWEVEGETDPVGAFRMHYTLERERGAADGPGGALPLPETQFSYSASWRVEPINAARGETEQAALAAGSEFHRVVDALDPRVTAVTFWVYPDSFSLYRRLRDLLHDRDFVVAGRPLPDGAPIGSSRNGTASRGQ